MKKKLFTLLCGLCLFNTAFSQTDTSKKKTISDYRCSFLFAGTYHVFLKLSHPFSDFPFSLSPFDENFADQWEGRFNCRISRNIQLGVGYATWNTVPALITRTYPTGQEIPGSSGNDTLKKGLLLTRRAYKMIDLYGMYTVKTTKRAEVNLGIGLSYAWGINNYVDTLYRYLHDVYIEGHDQVDHYWGIVPMASYNYFLWHYRVAVGCDLRWRKYFGFYSSQIDYGYHIIINF